MADKAHRLTDEKLEEMEKRLSAIYSRAVSEVGETWKSYLESAKDEIKDLQDQYQEAKKNGNKKEIRRAGIKLSKAKKERTLLDKHYRDLTEQLAIQLSNVNKTALAYINDQLPEVYSLNYNSIKSKAERINGYSFELADADTVKFLATTDESLLPYKSISKSKDVRWNIKSINAEVLQGILQGEEMPKIADRLSKVAKMNEVAAIRNARTMVTGAENRGRYDSYERLTDEGLTIKKRWDATLDLRTRHSHGMLDGVTVPHDKLFSNGLLYPGDPNGDPSEIYNCRCRMNADVGQKRGSARIARDENGKSVEVPMMTYKEWMEWRKKNVD